MLYQYFCNLKKTFFTNTGNSTERKGGQRNYRGEVLRKETLRKVPL